MARRQLLRAADFLYKAAEVSPETLRSKRIKWVEEVKSQAHELINKRERPLVQGKPEAAEDRSREWPVVEFPQLRIVLTIPLMYC